MGPCARGVRQWRCTWAWTPLRARTSTATGAWPSRSRLITVFVDPRATASCLATMRRRYDFGHYGVIKDTEHEDVERAAGSRHVPWCDGLVLYGHRLTLGCERHVCCCCCCSCCCCSATGCSEALLVMTVKQVCAHDHECGNADSQVYFKIHQPPLLHGSGRARSLDIGRRRRRCLT